MPLPITPLGRNGDYDNIFGYNDINDIATAEKYFYKESESDESIRLLEAIDKHQDGVVNAAIEAVSGRKGEKYYTVPQSISETALLKLKTEGYCLGPGRTVRFSEKAQKALTKRYLSTENKFKSSRKTKKII